MKNGYIGECHDIEDTKPKAVKLKFTVVLACIHSNHSTDPIDTEDPKRLH